MAQLRPDLAGPGLGRPRRDGDDFRPELADVGRLARRLVRPAVSAARAEEGPIRRLLADHLGPAGHRCRWPADHGRNTTR